MTTPKPNSWEEELEDLFSAESTEDGGHYLIASVTEVKNLLRQAILSAEANERKRIIRHIGWLKRNSPNPLKVDIVHNKVEFNRMKGNARWNEVIDFIIGELSLPDQEQLSNSKTE